ncbi:laccase [Parafrankia colletiae]|uniref:Purine nucleoside phosphorylase n=1 Tax=Parafrankia colletiae TaxID=573497 RepID=A0A1S1R8D1_9ACTN|nr:peptidoglycan editing factor PgeF [Parafrankia colletiae]MCK9900481.1 peptidoglycan editing factor PgeF [Frankia sp. Cpl3]OHV43183.1 laccase [Parafrankia colletiae]
MPVLVTSRGGGTSGPPYTGLNLGDHVGDEPAAVAENRRLVVSRIGRPVQFMRQVHGAQVSLVREAGPPPEADAMVTDVAGVALAVLVADCVPVMFESPAAVGVAHAGRQGMASGVLAATLAAFDELGVDRGTLRVTLGPAICAHCYEVPALMRSDVERVVPGSAATTRAGTPSLDLRAGLRGQLAAAGVGAVTVSDRCSAESDDLFSYRRDGRTGRFAGLAWLA